MTSALTDTKLGAEGRKDLFDWSSRQLSGLSEVADAVPLLKPAATAMMVNFCCFDKYTVFPLPMHVSVSF